MDPGLSLTLEGMHVRRTIGVVVNRDKPHADEIASRLVQNLDARGARPVLDEAAAVAIGRPDLGLSPENFAQQVDLLFVLGGDGTLLGVARQMACREIPLLGINIGHLGFLSEAEPEDLERAVQRVMTGDYHLERRMMIQASVVRGGRVVHQTVGLNDAGIGKGSVARMIRVQVYVDGELFDEFAGDGLIVSTPTGSTAYSLSCGGPIVAPHIQVMLLTPICAHTLVARPCVISDEQEVRVRVLATHRDLGLTMDGQVGFALQNEDEVVIRRAACDSILVRWQERPFFSILRSKLRGD